MSNDSPANPLPPELEAAIAKRAEAAVEAKLASYRKAAKWYLLGLGSLVIFLLAFGLISKQSLLRLGHDWVFGFEKSLDQVLHERVAVSYSNGFWLGTLEGDLPAQSVVFYAADGQEVMAIVEIQHQGTGELLEVAISLEGESDPIYTTAQDERSLPVKVSEWMTAHSHEHFVQSRPENVHVLVFSVPDAVETQDRVFVRSLITVSGLERGVS
ncbi:MAG: hypothetical protein GTO22_18940 [Gemmatimonadales bacterium]|nr:hypothetical protein [Gemmatimonadales bacterium]